MRIVAPMAKYAGERDARRRRPLRPSGHARARAARRRSALGVLRHHSAGSGRQPGQADRGAVGRRRRRLSGRQLPPLWSEWNGKYRDTVRDFWRGMDQTLAEFANRFTGSSDLYQSTSRRPHASINFITAHDGFTLRDLVSYNDNTTRPISKTIAMGRTTIDPGIAASKDRPTTPRWARCVPDSSGTSWRR